MGVRYLMQVHTECVCVLRRGAEVSRVVLVLTRCTRWGSSAQGALVSISIHRFAPTPAAKFGLLMDIAVLMAATAVATSGSALLRFGWTTLALIVFWSTSSVVHHYSHSAERAAWEDVVLTALNLL